MPGIIRSENNMDYIKLIKIARDIANEKGLEIEIKRRVDIYLKKPGEQGTEIGIYDIPMTGNFREFFVYSSLEDFIEIENAVKKGFGYRLPDEGGEEDTI